jgi:CRP/FNR family transcriptional regulator, cyclic AMP receptor protein
MPALAIILIRIIPEKMTLQGASVRTGWLGLVGDPLADAILAAGRWRSFTERSVIYSLGEDDGALWGIASGRVRMHVAISEQPPRFGHVAAPGFWFGELEFLTGLPRVIEMEAAGETKVLYLPSRELERIAAQHPNTWRALARLSALNEALAVAAVDDLLIRDPRKRLAAVLLRLSSHRCAFQGNPSIDWIPATQAELADATNLSRTKAAALLAEFAAAGLVTPEYRSLRIDDAKGLSGLL